MLCGDIKISFVVFRINNQNFHEQSIPFDYDPIQNLRTYVLAYMHQTYDSQKVIEAWFKSTCETVIELSSNFFSRFSTVWHGRNLAIHFAGVQLILHRRTHTGTALLRQYRNNNWRISIVQWLIKINQFISVQKKRNKMPIQTISISTVLLHAASCAKFSSRCHRYLPLIFSFTFVPIWATNWKCNKILI